jgi:hypothetical protein
MTRTLSATLTIAALLAACGGDRQQAAGRSDSAVTGAASAAPADTAARADSTAGQATAPAAPAESAASAPSASASQSAAPTDTGAKRPTASKADGKKLAASEAVGAHRTIKAPAGQAKRDTARVQREEQDTGKTASTTTAAAPSGGQDTTKAAAPAAGSTSTASAEGDQPLRDAYHQAPRDTVDQATYDGWKQFNLNCARCHGEDVLGTTIAPHLILSLKPDGPINTKELFVQTVCAGRPAKGMPSWCALGLDMNKINDIYLYVKGRSDAKIGPGRPAVKQGT